MHSGDTDRHRAGGHRMDIHHSYTVVDALQVGMEGMAGMAVAAQHSIVD